MTACPVRATQDPDVAEILGWFALTHELATSGFGAAWRLAWLPGPGGIGDQDARLLEGLAVARAVSQTVLVEEMQRKRKPAGGDE